MIPNTQYAPAKHRDVTKERRKKEEEKEKGMPNDQGKQLYAESTGYF
jgi:hypothetical protein